MNHHILTASLPAVVNVLLLASGSAPSNIYCVVSLPVSRLKPTQTSRHKRMLKIGAAFILVLFQLSCFALKPAPPLNIASITPMNFTTLENNTIFGLQDALNGKYDSGAITLFANACLQSDGTQNCTAACLSNTQMFSNLETLHNCALLPNILVHLANNNLSANARRIAEDLKIEANGSDSSMPSRISNTIQHCLLDSCNANTDCTGILNPINGSSKNHSPDNLNRSDFAETFLNICGPIPAYVNADVGGIGV